MQHVAIVYGQNVRNILWDFKEFTLVCSKVFFAKIRLPIIYTAIKQVWILDIYE